MTGLGSFGRDKSLDFVRHKTNPVMVNEVISVEIIVQPLSSVPYFFKYFSDGC